MLERAPLRLRKAGLALSTVAALTACNSPETGHASAAPTVAAATSSEVAGTTVTTAPRTTDATPINRLPEGPYYKKAVCDTDAPQEALDGGKFVESKPVTILVDTTAGAASIAVTNADERDEPLTVTDKYGTTKTIGGDGKGFVLVVEDGGTAVIKGRTAETKCIIGDTGVIRAERDSRTEDLKRHYGIEPVEVYTVGANDKLVRN